MIKIKNKIHYIKYDLYKEGEGYIPLLCGITIEDNDDVIDKPHWAYDDIPVCKTCSKIMDKRLKPIFVLTTMKLEYITYPLKNRKDGKESYRLLTTKRDRIVGWFPTLEEAIDEVENNSGDINEAGYYPWALIEETEPYLYPHIRSEHWYKWKGRLKGKYEPRKKPAAFNKTVNFGIG